MRPGETGRGRTGSDLTGPNPSTEPVSTKPVQSRVNRSELDRAGLGRTDLTEPDRVRAYTVPAGSGSPSSRRALSTIVVRNASSSAGVCSRLKRM